MNWSPSPSQHAPLSPPSLESFPLQWIVPQKSPTKKSPTCSLSSAKKYLQKLFAAARSCKWSSKGDKVLEPTHFLHGLQSEAFICFCSPISSCLYRPKEWSRTPALSLLRHMYRFLAKQGHVQCCQMQTASLSLNFSCSYSKGATIWSVSAWW